MVKRKECFAVEGGDVMFIAEKNMPMAYGSSLSGDRPVFATSHSLDGNWKSQSDMGPKHARTPKNLGMSACKFQVWLGEVYRVH